MFGSGMGGSMGGGMVGGGDADENKMMAALSNPNDPGAQAAQQAYQISKQQGMTQGQCLVAMTEAYERATGRPMPGAPSGGALQASKQFNNKLAADKVEARQAAQQRDAAKKSAAANATVISITFESATSFSRINDQPDSQLSLSGYAEYLGEGLQGTCGVRQTTIVSGTASPCWKETVKYEVVDFGKTRQSKVSFKVRGGKDKRGTMAGM
jgi:hypothetical protein